MMTRKFFNSTIEQLEAIVEQQAHNQTLMIDVTKELELRTTKRAKVLLSRIQNNFQKSIIITTPNSVGINYIPPKTDKPDKPENILSAWAALEVLSPQTFLSRTQLAFNSDPKLISGFENGLPWQTGDKSYKQDFKLFYQIVIGSIPMAPAVEKLMEIYADNRPERPSIKGEAILAVLVLDRNGKPVGDDALAISSFAWGLPLALQGKLGILSKWPDAERQLLSGLNKILVSRDIQEDIEPITVSHINLAYEYLISTLNLPPELVKRNQFAVRTFQYIKHEDLTEPSLLLNSFFLEDLAKASQSFANGKASPNLERYLGIGKSTSRTELLKDLPALQKLVAPLMMSSARWPARGKASLVLLQQAAINAARTELKNGGIFAVNGPPGTGKTTLLRDAIASIICDRAEAMCTFDEPEKAFYKTELVRTGAYQSYAYSISPAIKGFEILITSSNNKAVENVSAELPGLGTVESHPDLHYFKGLSDQLTGQETWGLIAAVLGNRQNRSNFKANFWWDKENGFNTYLAEITGTPQFINSIDPATNLEKTRKPNLIQQENPPNNSTTAIEDWYLARKIFLQKLHLAREKQKKLEDVKKIADSIPLYRNTVTKALAQQQKDAEDSAIIKQRESELKKELDFTITLGGYLDQELHTHQLTRPGWFSLLFGLKTAPLWKANKKEIKTKIDNNKQEIATLKSAISKLATLLFEAEQKLKESIQALQHTRKELAEQLKKLDRERPALGINLIDEHFAEMPHAERQLISPWQDTTTNKLRDDVFTAAMNLHKFFIHAAAKPIKNNLNILMSVFNGVAPDDKQKKALLPELWSTLFLVVPALSTTFASVGNMLADLPQESLGWLLIDEAGQALPQAAVGALMRSKKALIVGDPLQIEPVVSLPESLTNAINKHFAINPSTFNAPVSSVQTLADRAGKYFNIFKTLEGDRPAGLPLLVHRRCENPMFSTSNRIAYGGQMVHAKAATNPPIRDILGPSGVYDVHGTGHDKYSPEEGQVVLTLLRQLVAAGIKLDLYIVTPFVAVQDNLRTLILSSGMLSPHTMEPEKWVRERIGTVHTVQGREAEAVIFVLGAPLPEQNGARLWAGSQVNLLNVAVTRAKEIIYVIANKSLWLNAGHFGPFLNSLPVK
ncbi:MAG: hypothetical protein JWQ09_4919 [Segetibacter sp.]|nr:hypothetical protein [Segetibacter sp.]